MKSQRKSRRRLTPYEQWKIAIDDVTEAMIESTGFNPSLKRELAETFYNKGNKLIRSMQEQATIH